MFNLKILEKLTGENIAILIIFILMALLPVFISGYVIFILPQYILELLALVKQLFLQ